MTIDITSIAKGITDLFAPLLPYLLKGDEEALKVLGKKFGETLSEKVKGVWERLSGNEAVKRAAQDIVTSPDDPDAQVVLRFQLKQLMANDPALIEALGELLQDTQQQRIHSGELHGNGGLSQGAGALAAGQDGVVVGRDIGKFATGDGDILADSSHVFIANNGATALYGESPITMTEVDQKSALGRYLRTYHQP